MASRQSQREVPVTYSFPTASQPDIIRAHQKDVYYQNFILEHVENLVQSILGSRWLHSHRPLLKAVSDALYLGLTTAIGFRTLGEEYTEIYQTSSNRKPSALRRYGYVLAESLGFYFVIQFLWPRVRRRLQRQVDEAEGQNQRREKLLKGIIAVFENISSVHLALFYFLGTYYSLPKRIFRIRYIFTRRLMPNEERPGYELLGLLLFLQIATQSYLSLTSPNTESDPTSALIEDILTPPEAEKPQNITSSSQQEIPATKDEAEATQAHVLDLADDSVLSYIPSGSRRCPLCLDPMKDPTAAECGHLFCWTCILRWTGEAVGQGECPICRGRCGREGLLRLSG